MCLPIVLLGQVSLETKLGLSQVDVPTSNGAFFFSQALKFPVTQRGLYAVTEFEFGHGVVRMRDFQDDFFNSGTRRGPTAYASPLVNFELTEGAQTWFSIHGLVGYDVLNKPKWSVGLRGGLSVAYIHSTGLISKIPVETNTVTPNLQLVQVTWVDHLIDVGGRAELVLTYKLNERWGIAGLSSYTLYPGSEYSFFNLGIGFTHSL